MRFLSPLVLAFAIAEVVYSVLNMVHTNSNGWAAFWVCMAVLWAFNVGLWGAITAKAWRE